MGISDRLSESVSERLAAKVDRSSWRSWTFLETSPDSKRVAYAAMQKGKLWMLVRRPVVVVDGEEGKRYDGILKDTPIFSPDSKRVAYVAMEKGKPVVVVDGEEGKRYDTILKDSLIISPDDPDSIRYLALLGSSIYMVEARTKGKSNRQG